MIKKILYGCCYTADLNDERIDYVDIITDLTKSKGKYICKDIMQIDFDKYEIILCSPPCNYYSRANYRRNESKYSLETKHLLPDTINKAYKSNKPFIIENVRNSSLMYKLNIPSDVIIYEIGRHTYFTNRFFNFSNIKQIKDNIHYKGTKTRQGGYNVNTVFKEFIKLVENEYYEYNE